MRWRFPVLCRYLGHSWVYKDLREWLNADGSVYTENKKRKCTRCGLREYEQHRDGSWAHAGA